MSDRIDPALRYPRGSDEDTYNLGLAFCLLLPVFSVGLAVYLLTRGERERGLVLLGLSLLACVALTVIGVLAAS